MSAELPNPKSTSSQRLIQIKMQSGDSIIAELVNINLQTDSFIVKFPYRIYTNHMLTPEGIMTSYHIAPWFELEPDTETFVIPASRVIAHSFLSANSQQQFRDMVTAYQGEDEEAPELEETLTNKTKMN